MGRLKKAVDLVGGPRPVGSRIRRDPPPPLEKKLSPSELREREAWIIGTGITVFAIAMLVIFISIGRWTEHSPSETNILIEGF